MSIIIDKSFILKEIKLHLKCKTDAEFARFLDISPQLLSKWISRNTFDYELVYTKCPFVNGHWLITGEGPMLKTDQQIGDISNSTVVGSNVSGDGNQITHNDFAGMIELQKGYQQLLNRKDEQINRLLTIIENAQQSNMK